MGPLPGLGGITLRYLPKELDTTHDLHRLVLVAWVTCSLTDATCDEPQRDASCAEPRGPAHWLHKLQGSFGRTTRQLLTLGASPGDQAPRATTAREATVALQLLHLGLSWATEPAKHSSSADLAMQLRDACLAATSALALREFSELPAAQRVDAEAEARAAVGSLSVPELVQAIGTCVLAQVFQRTPEARTSMIDRVIGGITNVSLGTARQIMFVAVLHRIVQGTEGGGGSAGRTTQLKAKKKHSLRERGRSGAGRCGARWGRAVGPCSTETCSMPTRNCYGCPESLCCFARWGTTGPRVAQTIQPCCAESLARD